MISFKTKLSKGLWKIVAGNGIGLWIKYFCPDSSWFVLTHHNSSCLALTCPDSSWLVLTRSDLSWLVLICPGCPDSPWLALTHPDRPWLVLIWVLMSLDTFGCILTYFDAFWRILMCFDAFEHVWIWTNFAFLDDFGQFLTILDHSRAKRTTARTTTTTTKVGI